MQLDVQESTLSLCQERCSTLEEELAALRENEEVLEAIEAVKAAVEARGSQADLDKVNIRVDEVDRSGKDTERNFHFELEAVTRALERQLEEKAHEDGSALEDVHNRIDTLNAKIAAVKAKGQSSAGSNAAANEAPNVQGRAIQSAGRVRDDLTPGRIRAQSGRKTTQQRAGQFFAKPGLYTDQTGKEFHAQVRKPSGPGLSQTPNRPGPPRASPPVFGPGGHDYGGGGVQQEEVGGWVQQG